MEHIKIEKRMENVQLFKVDEELGIVYGFAAISKRDGKKYRDSQGEHIPENVMAKMAMNFMEGMRDAQFMHEDIKVGKVNQGLMLTDDVAKALGLTTNQTGFIIGMKVESAQAMDLIKSGKIRDFSIGGKGKRIEVTDE